jgi:hypothetical protein
MSLNKTLGNPKAVIEHKVSHLHQKNHSQE